MKKFAVLTAVLVFAGTASATGCQYSPGLTPGEPFYSLDRAAEQVNLFLTVGKDRDNLKLTMAEERLAEVRQLVNEGEEKEARRLLDDYSTLMSEAEDAENYTRVRRKHLPVVQQLEQSLYHVDVEVQKEQEKKDVARDSEGFTASGKVYASN